MYSFLPDELLKEILAPALQVPDDAFACTSTGRSPFSNYNPTTSGYLLVCKDWLRVATPLLYSVVVLRSKAQIQALDSAIEATPVLAGFIRKLRIECGYCPSLFKVMKSAKNLKDLCLSLEIYSSDSVSGFCKGLAFIHPHRLIIYDLGRPQSRSLNKKAKELTKALQDHIPSWNKLTQVTVPWNSSRWDRSLPNPEEFIGPICKCGSIEVVTIRFQHYCPWIKQLARVPTLKKIIVECDYPGQERYSELSSTIESDKKLKSLIELKISRRNLNPPQVDKKLPSAEGSNPPKSVHVAKGIASFPDNVWFNILYYASGLHKLEQLKLSELSYTTFFNYSSRRRRRLALTCKKFYFLVLPLHYRCVTIESHGDLSSIVKSLSQNKQLGKDVRTLLTHHQSYNCSCTVDLHELLPLTPNLRRLSTGFSWRQGHSNTELVDWQALTILAQSAGTSLVELSINLRRPGQPKTPAVFYQFTALKHLDIISSAVLAFDAVKAEKNALPNLESITSLMTSDTFLLFLSRMDLPKLRKANFPSMDKCDGAITFLRQHGHKLESLECGFLPGVGVFNACPNLKEFELPREKPGFTAAEFFFCSHRHPLEKLYIKTESVNLSTEKEKFRYLGSLDLSNFTSLRQIRVDKCVWPTTENEIKKSHWVAWAERLQELYQVAVVNKDGQKWVPRLKAKKDK